MAQPYKQLFKAFFIVSGMVWLATQASYPLFSGLQLQPAEEDTALADTTVKAEGPQFRLKDDPAYPAADLAEPEGIQLKRPSNIRSEVQYDPAINQYIFTNRVGNLNYRPSASMSREEYKQYELRRTIREYWRQQASGGQSKARGFTPGFQVGGEVFQKVFGGNTINIIPQGEATLIFGGSVSTINNPQIPENLRTVWSFDFDEKINMNVTGTIGERVKLGVSYNTDAMFDFENRTKLEYNGDEDDIVRKVEAGDVTLPLPGTLISGSQSLFGIKTELQFGKLNMTTVLSQQRGQTQVIQVQGGAQVTPFEITADEYDANKHFFLSHTFASQYDAAHKYLPRIASNITITRIEVWVTNRNKANVENVRAIYAFADLAEIETANLSNPSVVSVNVTAQTPFNEANTLYDKVKDAVRAGNDDAIKQLGLRDGIDYEKIKSARRLNDNEYTFDPNLGFISLNTALNNDEVLGVAFEYIYNGKTYKVGDLSTDISASKMPLVLKMLKGTNLSPSQKTWRLMMKNIYSLNAYDISSDDFYLDVLYRDDAKGSDVNYIPEKTGNINNIVLLRLLNLDRINSQMESQPDGVFDFIDRVTIDKRYGRIIFPMREPFGRYLDSVMERNGVTDPLIRKKYTYNELYDSTKTKAQLVSEKNKFKLKGTFKSASSSEIYLNASNIPQGSVKVSAGGIPLTENVDYVVDYAMGTVKIINSGVMSSGQPIKVSLESNTMFNMQTKTMIGTHLDYKISDDFNIGATILHLNEQPFTNKVNIGDEPISNTIWGLNTTYRTRSQFLTTLVDKLPLLQTKEPSTITFTGEFAQLVPGSSRYIGKKGVAYIDDFEGSEIKYDLKQFYGWTLSSTPARFPESVLSNDLRYNFNRAKLSWYVIDQSIYRNDSYTPSQIKQHKEWLQTNEAREIYESELFPNKQVPNGVPTNIYTLNLTYYPDVRGPYNFTTQLTPDGRLTNPEQRWGGMMKALQTTDFEAANISYIEFWMMDPFIDDSSNTGGELYFNLGDLSEDILKDGQMSFEQGLPTPGDSTPIKTSVWGKVAQTDPLTQSFTNGVGVRKYQDVGLDGLNDEEEKSVYANFLSQIQSVLTPEAYAKFEKDPAGDDFRYFRDPSYDATESNVNERYQDYNGVENNSPEAGSTTSSESNYSTPDMEDVNNDNTLSDKENYYEYRIELRPNLKVGESYVVNERNTSVPVLGKKVNARWLQFKIPIENFDRRIGNIEDFKSIRFIRMYLTGFRKKTTLRFATLNLVRSEWRKYLGSLQQGSEGISDQGSAAGFDIQSINLEENSNYVIPPGIKREYDPAQAQLTMQNEQSMVLKVSDLADGDARAAFKTGKLDARQYKRLKMEVHCQPLDNINPLDDGDVTVFIRLGSDNKNNYYEYEVPMKVTRYNDVTVPEKVWPQENKFDIDLNIFQRIKQARNDAGVSMQQVYHMKDGKNNVYICGNPTLSEIRVIMIGVRNPTARNNPYRNDGLPKSAEIWVNELRLTDFSDKGGWAANARTQVKLADFGNIRMAGSTIQPGFGSLESKVNDREKAQTNQYDLSGDFEMGKFFPSKAQVQIPLYMAYSQTLIKPQYNPLDPDIPLQAALDNAPNKRVRDSILRMSIDRVLRRSINFTNVKINKTSRTPRFYDPANFSVSYGYYEQLASNYKTEYNNLYHHEGSFNYIFNNRPKNIAPFQNIAFFNKPYLRLIRDFNFYYAPTSVAFRTNITRDYHTLQLRNLAEKGLTIPLTIEKSFLWNRMYDIKYDLSRSIKIDFSATNYAYIDEWDRTMDSSLRSSPRYDKWRQIKNGGHNRRYTHQFNVNYNVPINKLPLLDWTSASARYGGTYEWQLQPKFTDENGVYTDLGNSIGNTRSIQLNGNISLTTLYNKVPIFRDLQGQPRRDGQQQKEKKTVTFDRRYLNLKAQTPRSIAHNLKTQDVVVKVTDENGKEVKGTLEVPSINRVVFTPETDVPVAYVRVEGKVDVGPNPFEWIARNTARLLLGLKSVNGSYTETNGTSLSGYTKGTKFLGMSGSAPGIPFILGDQSNDNIRKMVERDWIVSNTMLQTNLLQTTTKTISFRANYEPFPGVRVDLNTNYSRSTNKTASYLPFRNDTNYLLHFAQPNISGNFSMTIISLKSFEKLNAENFRESKYYAKFKENRYRIIARLQEKYANYPSYQNDPVTEPGFKENSQQVLIPAFLATYGGYDPGNFTLDLFPSLMFVRPNWRVNITSLSQIPLLAEYFQSINISHAYASTYSIGSYVSNSIYREGPDGFSNVRDQLGNYAPMYDVSSVTINEQFSPMFGVDATLKNNLTLRFEYKKSRSLMLGLTNYTLNENYATEYVIGSGYRFPDIPLTMITFGAVNSPVKSDLDLRADLSIRDDLFFIRRLDIADQQVTNGNKNIKISFTADYQLSDRLTVQAFYDRLLTEPHISTSYKTINTKFGFSIRFTLTQ